MNGVSDPIVMAAFTAAGHMAFLLLRADMAVIVMHLTGYILQASHSTALILIGQM